ncbi:SCP2 sterol-binding domain-containing protein [Halomarina litorea]|uniref:SCP2 sterol-binding domain-containing protein n=1 Tax=Halomarina litorea TaxID=2961595 RepID=UPI0020C3C57E|nr:SCP2 sterol-binding domain-containing protein [Halomarina sp. BCD28]
MSEHGEWFPSAEWLEAYGETLNDDETYRTESEGWGVDFEGDFLFAITDLPVEERTVGDLPEALSAAVRESLESLSEARCRALRQSAPPAFEARLDAASGDPCDRLAAAFLSTPLAECPDVTWPALRAELSEDVRTLLDQFDRYVHGDTVYAYLDLRDGTCEAVEVLESPSARDPGFALTGPYEEWLALVEGEDVLESVLGDDLSLDGSVTTVMSYAGAAEAMGDAAGRVETRALF